MSIEEKIKTLNLVPPVVEEIITALEKEGIIEDERLDLILPALARALSISKAGEGKYNVSLTNDAGQLLTNDAGTPFTIEDWISDYVFPPETSDTRKTISYEDSLHPTDEQLTDIASGKLKVLPKKKDNAGDKAIPSSELKDKSSRNEVSVEDVASGKTKVDMSK